MKNLKRVKPVRYHYKVAVTKYYHYCDSEYMEQFGMPDTCLEDAYRWMFLYANLTINCLFNTMTFDAFYHNDTDTCM